MEILTLSQFSINTDSINTDIALQAHTQFCFQSTENIYEPEYQSGYDSSYDIQFVFYDEEENEEEELDEEDIIAPLDISPSGQFFQH